MKSSLIAAAGLVALTLTTVPASADTRNFTLVNNTNVPITAVYFSLPIYDQWVRSAGMSYLGPGKQGTISFNNTGPCALQMRVDFGNGYHTEWADGFNFCSVSVITIWYDSNANVVHARYE